MDRHTDMDRIFNIDSGNGSIFTSKLLDRETLLWHNITVIATEISKCDLMQLPSWTGGVSVPAWAKERGGDQSAHGDEGKSPSVVCSAIPSIQS